MSETLVGAAEAMRAVLAWIAGLLNGPFGGLLGGALSFWLLDLKWKRHRTQHDVAEALAAELATNEDRISTVLKTANRAEISGFYRTSRVVFDAVAGRLGELEFPVVASVAQLYFLLEDTNRLPRMWRERAQRAGELVYNDPVRVAEITDLAEGAKQFYETLEGLREDCERIGANLRTRYPTGWRAMIPLRLRPALPAKLPT